MKLGYDQLLFLVAFDHRSSFSRGLFGATEPLPPEIRARIADTKELILEAFEEAISRGASPRVCGVLVDEQFGAAVARKAKALRFILAMPVEQSGQREFELQYGDEFGSHIESFDPAFCKVLVRYNPEGDRALNGRQTEKLARLSDWIHKRARKLLFELLVPATPAQLSRCGNQDEFDRQLRSRLVVEALRELQRGGVEPDIWKIEGLETEAECERVVAQARAGVGRDGVVCIVLGRGASHARVLGWLATAAPVRGFDGFAIGRTLWLEPLQRFIANQTTREGARSEIADGYLSAIAAYIESAKRGGKKAPVLMKGIQPKSP